MQAPESNGADAGPQATQTDDKPATSPGDTSKWSAPLQRVGDTSDETAQESARFLAADLRDQPPISVAGQFRDLRARLFGSTPLTEYPVSIPETPPQSDLDTFDDPHPDTTGAFFERDDDQHDDRDDDDSAELDGATVPAAALSAATAPEQTSDRTPDISVVPLSAPGSEPEQRTTASPVDATPATSDGPIGPLDWAMVSTQYVPDVEEHETRNRVIALLALALVVVGVGVWMLFGPNSGRDRPTTRASSTAAPTAGAVAGTPGIDSWTEITDDRHVVVSQDVVFKAPVSVVVLEMPTYSDTPATEEFDPHIDELSILVEGVPVDASAAEALAPGTAVEVPLPIEAQAVTVKYTVSGAVVDRGTKPGRGLALANPIDVRSEMTPVDAEATNEDKRLPTNIVVLGPRILNLSCAPPGETAYTCGSDAPGDWEYQDTGTDEIAVVAQVDLPPE
jgi:hypothetical protein